MAALRSTLAPAPNKPKIYYQASDDAEYAELKKAFAEISHRFGLSCHFETSDKRVCMIVNLEWLLQNTKVHESLYQFRFSSGRIILPTYENHAPENVEKVVQKAKELEILNDEKDFRLDLERCKNEKPKLSHTNIEATERQVLASKIIVVGAAHDSPESQEWITKNLKKDDVILVEFANGKYDTPKKIIQNIQTSLYFATIGNREFYRKMFDSVSLMVQTAIEKDAEVLGGENNSSLGLLSKFDNRLPYTDAAFTQAISNVLKRKPHARIFCWVGNGHNSGILEDLYAFCPDSIRIAEITPRPNGVFEKPRTYNTPGNLNFADEKKVDENASLILAANRGQEQLVKTILNEQKDCDVNAIDKNGMTALMHAAFWGHANSIIAILEQRRDCNINAVDFDSMTALMYAIDHKYMDVARILVAHGAKLELPASLSTYPKAFQANLNDLVKEKKLNLTNPIIRDYISKGLLNENQAAALSATERKTVENTTLKTLITETRLTVKQILALSPSELAGLKIAVKTLTLFPTETAPEVKPTSVENYLQDTLTQLKTIIHRETIKERKGEPDFVDTWLTSIQSVLNADMTNASLPILCSDLDRALTPLKEQHLRQSLLAVKNIAEGMSGSVSAMRASSFFSKSPKDYHAELIKVLNSKMQPHDQIKQIRKSLNAALEHNYKIFEEMANALKDGCYFEIFQLQRKINDKRNNKSLLPS